MRIEHLISLPPAMARVFSDVEERPEWFATSDPPGSKLGSGGGVTHLLASAWREQGERQPLQDWLRATKRLALLAGGLSRRLPAYAAPGKILMPIPVLRWATGQRLDQSLLDLQLPDYERILAHAPDCFSTMVASGDVILRFAPVLPAFPRVDVLGLGMWVDAETAAHFGVFFTPRSSPTELAFFLQKPDSQEICDLATDHLFLVDTGMWLLSPRAVAVLLHKCGWQDDAAGFTLGLPSFYELYSQFGPCLGSQPRQHDPEIASLTSAVIPLPDAHFHHFGTSRQMIESVSALQNASLDQTRHAHPGHKPHPDMYVLNSAFTFPTRSSRNQMVWVENCALPPELELAHCNVLTGIPSGNWTFRIEPGACLDFTPVNADDFCVRAYGFDDPFKGAVEDGSTLYLGRPFIDWLAARGLTLEDAGIDPQTDIQEASLFPVLSRSRIDSPFLEWLFAQNPLHQPDFRTLWLQAHRLSAREIAECANLPRLYDQRRSLAAAVAPVIFEHREVNPFYRLDLDHTAKLFAASGAELPPPAENKNRPLELIHEEMFRAAVARRRHQDDHAAIHETRAFTTLREMIVGAIAKRPVLPRCNLVDDQIVWGRSPVRLDLAGGWTDTPPYCLKFGGSVVNLAVNLNGQPPVQVFARYTTRPELVIRSIDLGAETRISTIEDLHEYDRVGGEFSLAKAALALAGFHPRFSGHTGAGSLAEILEAFGGGLEISLLAATPKGSGLGTSSILAATLLGTLSEACGLNWDSIEIFHRTLALEQLLTTGGGWQDQAGGIFRGVKIIETTRGLDQTPQVRWLPPHLFGTGYANHLMLLYYTGLTRVAKGILQEIVRGMFLNRGRQLAVMEHIALQSAFTAEAIQRDSWDDVCAAVRGSWELNQALDSGTNPPEVSAILDRIKDYLAAAKLLGAGGGGYVLFLAKDTQAAARIRETLTNHPPNPRARFVEIELSGTGLQITRS